MYSFVFKSLKDETPRVFSILGPFAKPSAANDSLIGAIYDIAIMDVKIEHVGNGREGVHSMLVDTDHMYAGRVNHTSSIEGQPQDPAHGFFEQHLVGPNITIARVTATVSGGGARDRLPPRRVRPGRPGAMTASYWHKKGKQAPSARPTLPGPPAVPRPLAGTGSTGTHHQSTPAAWHGSCS